MVFTKRSTRHDEHSEQPKQRAEVHRNHRIVDPMLQTPVEKTCRQKHFEKSANVFEVAPDSCSPEVIQCHTQKFRNSRVRMHIQQQHAHLQKTIVFEPTSCTKKTSYFCRSLRRPFDIGTLKPEQGGKNTACGRVAPVQDSSVLTPRPEVLLKS